jgi:hypothetical protein
MPPAFCFWARKRDIEMLKRKLVFGLLLNYQP